MRICAKRYSHRTGFTLVEMLAAIAIIAVLISLIIPALSMVRRSADMARQRAQLHSIDIALEAFRADDGDYPPSDDHYGDSVAYPGAMKLAEAIIGQDGFGFHPKSEFRNDGLADWDGDGNYTTEPDESVYHVGRDTEFETEDENLSARKGPYLELETANAVRLRNIYRTPLPYGLLGDRFVLCDMFRLVKNIATGKRTGMPILYYRANTSNFIHDPEYYEDHVDDNIYDHLDNRRILMLTMLWEGTVQHPMRPIDFDGPRIFYRNTLNPNFPPSGAPPDRITGRPYRADSFILLSAGPDGRYGTTDDVFNFNKGE